MADVRSSSSLGRSKRLPSKLAEFRILDPACGSGHFLAGAFDLLVPLYREEAQDFGAPISDEQIAESILRHNLFGVDIDRRAVQVAAAVLYLKARRLARGGRIPPMNLVATAFDLDGLGEHDPALDALVRALPSGQGDVTEAVKTLRHVGLRGSLMRFGGKAVAPTLFQDLGAVDHIEQFVDKPFASRRSWSPLRRHAARSGPSTAKSSLLRDGTT